MLAKVADALPPEGDVLYEPKWDGFRALVFRKRGQVYLQSRDLRPLDRYFPDLQAALAGRLPGSCVLDGEIVIATGSGIDFDALQLRLHPAASRVAMLAARTPASFIAFDLLAAGRRNLMALPQAERRARLEELLAGAEPPLHLTPMTRDRRVALDWLDRFEGAGLDGVIAKPASLPYLPGKRAMLKIKHVRTADCVVAGFRFHKSGEDAVGSLLLGLFDDAGVLQHVGPAQLAAEDAEACPVATLISRNPYADFARVAAIFESRAVAGAGIHPTAVIAADADIAKAAQREFKKQGLDIKLGCKVSSAEVKKGEVHLGYNDGKSDQTLVVDRLLVAVGRRANTAGLLTDDAGVKLTERGLIEVDEHCATAAENVWAIGDCVRGPMLAHKASEEGIAVAERIAGKPAHVDFNTVPWVIYTEPEIAWVGQTEKELKNAGVPYSVGTFPFAAIGRAVAMNETAGLVKVIAHAETDRILGMHLCGANVSELVHEGVVAMEFKGSAEDLARICHAHPTLSEAVHEAALAVDKRAIHKAN